MISTNKVIRVFRSICNVLDKYSIEELASEHYKMYDWIIQFLESGDHPGDAIQKEVYQYVDHRIENHYVFTLRTLKALYMIHWIQSNDVEFPKSCSYGDIITSMSDYKLNFLCIYAMIKSKDSVDFCDTCKKLTHRRDREKCFNLIFAQADIDAAFMLVCNQKVTQDRMQSLYDVRDCMRISFLNNW